MDWIMAHAGLTTLGVFLFSCVLLYVGLKGVFGSNNKTRQQTMMQWAILGFVFMVTSIIVGVTMIVRRMSGP